MSPSELERQESYPKEIDSPNRECLRSVFDNWLEFQATKKAKWAKVIRFKFCMGRMKLNRVLLAWKV